MENITIRGITAALVQALISAGVDAEIDGSDGDGIFIHAGGYYIELPTVGAWHDDGRRIH